jgi:hypothetical protein
MSNGVKILGAQQFVYVTRIPFTNSPIHQSTHFFFDKATFSPQITSMRDTNVLLMEKTKPFAEKKVMEKIKEEIFGLVRNNV